jgi:prepilin-type N-terminal cleavage/methylation domain-containing protein
MATRRTRSGYTLFEVLLVMAIIVLVTVIFLPTLDSMYGYHKMSACLDGIRGAWVTARSQAIEDSRPYRFAVSGGFYRVAPDSNDYFSGDPPAQDANHRGLVLTGSLPAGVTFNANGQNSFTVPSQDKGQEAAPSGNWKTLSVFLPDGTATQDIDLFFNITGTRPRSIHLRSLTGTISVKAEGEGNH